MSMTNVEWDTYAIALNALRKSGVFGTFVSYHNKYQLQGHGGCYFLPWHRQYLFEFERELNKISPGVSIPYWDWTKSTSNSSLPVNQAFTTDPIWNRAGGSKGYGPIPNPPFQGWSANNRTCLRDFVQNNGNIGGSNRAYVFLSSQQVALMTSSFDPYSNFSTFLEANHGTPHVAVGATMSSVPLSPTDPIFWSHHAFIDKIWHDWQENGNGNAFGGWQANPRRTCTLDGEALTPPVFNRTVRQVLGDISQCVTYANSVPAVNISTRMRRVDSGRKAAGRHPSAARSAFFLSSLEEKRGYQRRIAHKKRSSPELYRSEVKLAVSAVDSMVRACHITNIPVSQIAMAEEAFHGLLLKQGVDVVFDKHVVESDTQSIMEEGAVQLTAIDEGLTPPGTTDDDLKTIDRGNNSGDSPARWTG
jgi:Common central domain of tyrosinase